MTHIATEVKGIYTCVITIITDTKSGIRTLFQREYSPGLPANLNWEDL